MWQYFLYELKSKRGSMIGWGLGITVFGLIYVGLYPSFEDQVSLFEEFLDIPIYQAMGITTMSTFAGWMASTVLNFLPIIIGIYALITGTGTLAGEEERGTLENIAALPLARWQIVTSKFLSILLALLGILLVSSLGILAITAWVRSQVAVEVGTTAIFWAVMSAFPLLAFLSTVALWLGAFMPTRAAAGGVATVVLIASYLSNNLFGQIEILRDYRIYSPFYYYNATETAFTEGVVVGDVLVLAALASLFFGLALLSFQRRNLMTYAWFWQRSRIPEA
jgi:ABC-2 type transport system permease protein